MQIYPMKLSDVTKSPIWGGTRLLREWGKTSPNPTVGESWVLTVRENGMSRVLNGAYAGMPLDRVISLYGKGFLSPEDNGNVKFPLLIKFLDAADTLSVQIHPDDAYAARVEHDRGKTEMWYIVEADEGAELVFGLIDGATKADFAAAVRAGDPERVLKRRKVHAGETYFIPSGLPHAIGGGILIAEIQQNCDLTYRVYDFNRRQPDGTLRELHVEKAIEAVIPYTDEEMLAQRYECEPGADPNGDLLAACRYFRVEKHTVRGEEILPGADRMRHFLCLGGKAAFLWNGERYPVEKGDSYLLPPCGEMRLSGDAQFLVTTVGTTF